MAYPRFIRARSQKTILSNTGSSLATSSTTWVELATTTNGPGAGGFDLILPAQAGDVIEYSVNGMWANEAVASRMDIATIVAAAIANSFSGQSLASATFGIQGWSAQASAFSPITGSAWRTLVAGDVSGGLVTLRPYVRVDSAVTKTFLRASANPFFARAINLGPVDPF